MGLTYWPTIHRANRETWKHGRRVALFPLVGYQAGDSLSTATFSRASVATEYSASGVVTTAASGVARDSHYLGGVRTLLLESAGTNLIARSEPALAQLAAKSAGVTDAAALGQGLGGSIQFPAGATSEFAYVAVTYSPTTTYVMSAFVIMDDGSAPVPGISATSGDFALVANGNQITTTPTVTRIGTTTLYRCSAVYTTGASPTNGNTGIVRQSTESGKAFRVTGYDLKVAATLSSYIPTSGTSATRATDALTLPGVTTGTATLYQRWLDPVTAAVNESATAYTSGATITPTVDRAYTHIAVLTGTLSAADCRAQVGAA